MKPTAKNAFFHSTSLALRAALVLSSTLLGASAATFTWDGGGADALTTNGLNWVGDVAPTANQDIVFGTAGAGGSTINWASGNINTLTFSAGASAFTFATSALQFPTAGTVIANNSSVTQSITSTTTLFGNSVKTISAVTADLALGNVQFRGDALVGGNTNSLTLTGASNGTISGTITNNANVPASAFTVITKSGAGTWTLGGANTSSARIAINNGVLKIGTATSLGFGATQTSVDAATSVTATGALDLNGVSNVLEKITLNGTGFGANGGLINSSVTAASITNGVTGMTAPLGGIAGVVYSSSSIPAVAFVGGGGTGATATASLGLTQASFSFATAGTAWVVGNTFTITGGGGSGALGTVNTITAGGAIDTYTLTSPGSGFTGAPTIVTKTGAVVAGATATISGNATNFAATGFTITNAGSGYTSTPTVTLDGVAQTATVSTSGVVLAANSSVGGTGDITINAPVTGAFALTKTGTNTVTLTGVDTFNNAVVSSGTLNLSPNRTAAYTGLAVGGATGTTPKGVISGGTTSFSGQVVLGTAGAGAASIDQTGGTISSIGGSGLLIGNGSIPHSATYNLSGDSLTVGTVILGVNAPTTGTTTTSFNQTGGAFTPTNLQIGRYATAGATGTNNTFAQSAGTATVTNFGLGGNATDAAGTNPITSTLTLTGGTFTATTFVSLSAGGANTSTITIGGTAVATLPAFPTGRGTGSAATITFDGGTLKPKAASTAYMGGLTNAYITANGAKFDTGFDITVSQALENAPSQVGPLTKSGASTLTLSGTNTYTGSTTVSDGTLLLNGDNTAATGAVTVNSPGTLGGNGTLGGALTVSSGSNLAPGAASATVGTLTAAAGASIAGTYACDVDGATADKLAVTGTVTLSGPLTVNLLAGGFTQPSYIITEGTTLSGTFSSVPTGYLVTYNSTQAILSSTADAYTTWINSFTPNALLPDAASKLPGADPDGDGISNLLEFVLTGSPVLSSQSINPTLATVGSNQVLSYKRSDESESPVTTQVGQWSTNLATWTDVTPVVVNENGAAPDDMTITVPNSNEVAGKLFLRLKVEK